MKLSVLVHGAQRPQQTVPYAGAVKWGAAHRLWFGQGTGFDSAQLAAWLAGLGLDVPIGFGVSLAPLQSPHRAALEMRSLAAMTGHPVVAGFGPGSTMLQAGVLGARFTDPQRAMREYVTAIRILLGATAGFPAGAEPPLQFPLPVGPLASMPGPPVEIGLGVLSEATARVAAEVADAAITWLLPSAHLADVITPILSAGSPATAPRLVAIVAVALDRPGRDVTPIAGHAVGAHLAEPHYRRALQVAGVPLVGEPGPDIAAALDHGLVVYGDPDAIAARLDAYARAGVDEVVLNVSGVAQVHGGKAALDDLRLILEHTPAKESIDA